MYVAALCWLTSSNAKALPTGACSRRLLDVDRHVVTFASRRTLQACVAANQNALALVLRGAARPPPWPGAPSLPNEGLGCWGVCAPVRDLWGRFCAGCGQRWPSLGPRIVPSLPALAARRASRRCKRLMPSASASRFAMRRQPAGGEPAHARPPSTRLLWSLTRWWWSIWRGRTGTARAPDR